MTDKEYIFDVGDGKTTLKVKPVDSENFACATCPKCHELIKNVKLYDKVYNENGIGSISKTICPNCGKEIILEDVFDILPELKMKQDDTRGED